MVADIGPLGSALIGGLIPAVIALLGFVFGYGKLSSDVQSLGKSVDRLSNRQEETTKAIGELGERVAKLEGSIYQGRPEPQH